MNMSELDTDRYDQAVADLSSPQTSTKEAAERTLLQARDAGIAALMRGLEKPAEQVPMPQKAKLALMLGARILLALVLGALILLAQIILAPMLGALILGELLLGALILGARIFLTLILGVEFFSRSLFAR